jgi:hypothetical protein
MSGKFLTNIIDTDALVVNNKSLDNTDSPYAVLDTDFALSCDASDGEITINLPDPTTMSGRILSIKITTGGYPVTLSCAQLIDGSSTLDLVLPYEGVMIYSNGTSWSIISDAPKDPDNLDAYGIKIDDDSGIVTRIGLAKNLSRTDFDTLSPWQDIKRCNVADDLTINAYYGDAGYVEDGTNGQVMVTLPNFYYAYFHFDHCTYIYIKATDFVGSQGIHPVGLYSGGTYSMNFVSAYEGSGYVSSDVYSVNTLTVTAGATSDGDTVVTLDGTGVNIAVTNGDTAEQVATKIRAGVFAGWVASGAGTSVIFTATAYGWKPGAFTVAGQGVTGTFAVTVPGRAVGYNTNDGQNLIWTVGNYDKLCSIASVKPASGSTQSLHIVNSRIIASNRGTGWGLLDFWQISAIQALLYIEYGGLNSQTLIGKGVVDKASGTGNESDNTGDTASLGNASGREAGTDGLTSVSYRGIENLWGNIWQWIDGININNNIAYVANESYESNKYTSPYVLLGTLSNKNGYFKKALYAPSFPCFLPDTIGASTTTYYCDYYYQSAGARVALLGGSWTAGLNYGVGCWGLDLSSGYSSRYVGARLGAKKV